jgi:hypothetical protein
MFTQESKIETEDACRRAIDIYNAYVDILAYNSDEYIKEQRNQLYTLICTSRYRTHDETTTDGKKTGKLVFGIRPATSTERKKYHAELLNAVKAQQIASSKSKRTEYGATIILCKSWFTDHNIKLEEVTDSNGKVIYYKSELLPEEHEELRVCQQLAYISELESDLHSKERQLHQMLQNIQNTVKHALESIEQHEMDNLNSFGIFQGRGNEVDRLIGEISELHKTISSIQKYFV